MSFPHRCKRLEANTPWYLFDGKSTASPMIFIMGTRLVSKKILNTLGKQTFLQSVLQQKLFQSEKHVIAIVLQGGMSARLDVYTCVSTIYININVYIYIYTYIHVPSYTETCVAKKQYRTVYGVCAPIPCYLASRPYCGWTDRKAWKKRNLNTIQSGYDWLTNTRVSYIILHM